MQSVSQSKDARKSLGAEAALRPSVAFEKSLLGPGKQRLAEVRGGADLTAEQLITLDYKCWHHCTQINN